MSQDDLEPLPTALKRLLQTGRPGDEPPPGAREAALSFVAMQAGVVGAAALVHGATHGVAHAASAGTAVGHASFGRTALATLRAFRGSIGIGGLVVGAAVGTGVGAASHAAMTSGRSVLTPAVAVHSDVSAAPSVAAVSANPAPSASTTAPFEAAPSVPRSPPGAPQSPAAAGAHVGEGAGGKDTSLRSEDALIDMARTAVARGQGDAALGPLERHGRDFPHGRLAEDREWLWIQALLLSGRTDAARERASNFRRAFPRSLMLPALDEVLPSAPPTPP